MVRITMEDGGIIDIELNEEAAPITCENFKKLVSEGFYNGLTFHRVIPGFMIQAAARWATQRRPGLNIKGEFANGVNNPIKHPRRHQHGPQHEPQQRKRGSSSCTRTHPT
ncbi:MAG: peptidylprolyl isomerase [Oscillospiraceae bacterium]